MRTNWISIVIFICFSSLDLFAQVEKTEPIEEEIIEEEDEDFGEFDFSQLVATEKVKAFCSSKILGQGPTSLVSLGYDLQSAFDIDYVSGDGEIQNYDSASKQVNSVNNFFLAANYPVISKNSILLNLGFSYNQTRFQTNGSEGFTEFLNNRPVHNLSFTPTLFKPLNRKTFLLLQAAVAFNGNGLERTLEQPELLRYSGAAIFGFKSSDHKMWGVGLSRTYLAGALNYIPVIYYRYSHPNGKWGIESVLPSRFQYRRTLNKKNILYAGYMVNGASNNLTLNEPINNTAGINNLELRRSELRFHLQYDHALTNLIWMSVQAGYRYNWQFNLDEGEFLRDFFSDKAYYQEMEIGNTVYINLSLNFMSP